MEIWNREQLYAEIWEIPLVKLAPKYGISAVALGKVCRKLQIPLPGRGYWVKKDFGKPVSRIPLPESKNLPVVRHMKQPPTDFEKAMQKSSEQNLEDPELIRIAALEASSVSMDPSTKPHKLVSTAGRILRHSSPDERSILQPPRDEPCLQIRVSKVALNRALDLINAIILKLESENLPVSAQKGSEGTAIEYQDQRVPFAIVERTRVKARREVKEYSWTRTITEYEPTGELEFRVLGYGHGFRKTWADGKTRRLEDLMGRCVGALLREGRYLRIQAQLSKERELERQRQQQEMAKLAELIDEEEKKIRNLNGWVDSWARAEQIRGFVVALEKVWTQEGHDLSPEAPKGRRIIWMRQQTDRVDPMLQNPPSILDRKSEPRRW